MTSHLRILDIRRRLGRDKWGVPLPYGPDGFIMEHRTERKRMIVTYGPAPEGDGNWVHASVSRPDSTPTYEDLVELHRGVWGTTGWSYQVFTPDSEHINIHPYALHLWGRLDGSNVLPNFGAAGTI